MTDSTKLYFEDIETGMTFTTGSITIDAAEIRSFARKFDPQPYHLDRDAADASLFGGLCASGWHVCALMMRMLSDCLDDAGFVIPPPTRPSSLRRHHASSQVREQQLHLWCIDYLCRTLPAEQ